MDSRRLRAFTIVLVSATANAFSFSATTPTQCDNLNVTWIGGEEPFQLLITPIYGIPLNISIPSSAVSNKKGVISTQLAMPKGSKFLLTMSDGTGFGSGGTSQILTVGPSVTGASCNTTDPGTEFTYELPSALQQCNYYTFTAYDNATQPITIYGLIPGGQTTIMNPPVGPSYEWNTDVAAGTTMVFLMIDSKGRQGGSSDILMVASSSDSTCLNARSPTSTVSPSASRTGLPVATAPQGAPASASAIAGTAIGALIALAVLVTLGLFLLKQWKGDNRSVYDSGGLGRHRPQRLGSTDHIVAPQYSRSFGGDQALNVYQYPFPSRATALSTVTPVPPPSGRYEHRPFNLPSSANLHSRSTSRTEPGSPIVDTELSQAGRQKAALAGASAYKPSRFILHTDVEEAIPDEQDIVELPPQYTDRRQLPSDVQRQPSNSVNRQPSRGARKRSSVHVPLDNVPPMLPDLPKTSPLGGKPWF